MRRVLLADDDSNLALGFGALHVRRTVHAQKLVAMSADERVPPAHVPQRGRIYVAVHEPEGLVKYRGAGILELLKVGVVEGSRVRLPGQDLLVVERQQPEHVDDGRAADQIQRPRGVLELGRRREKTEPPPVDKRRTEGTR